MSNWSRSLVLATIVSAGLGTHVLAQSLEGPTAAEKRGDVPAVVALLSPLAERGNIEAQYKLGDIYAKGVGVAQDFDLSDHWYQAAAQQGFSFAQVALGEAYERGQGMPVSPDLAAQWFKRAADQGNPQGMLHLASLTAGTNDGEALMWLDLAIPLFRASDTAAKDAAAQLRAALLRKLTAGQLEQIGRDEADWKSKHSELLTRISAVTGERCGTGERCVYPEDAQIYNVEGRSVMRCDINEGSIGSCSIVEEEPKGWGFGAAELNMLSDPAFKNAVIQRGMSRGGAAMVPVEWKLPHK
jgi:hypothetical protein